MGLKRTEGLGTAPGLPQSKDNEKVLVLSHTGWEGWTQGSGDGGVTSNCRGPYSVGKMHRSNWIESNPETEQSGRQEGDTTPAQSSLETENKALGYLPSAMLNAP